MRCICSNSEEVKSKTKTTHEDNFTLFIRQFLRAIHNTESFRINADLSTIQDKKLFIQDVCQQSRTASSGSGWKCKFITMCHRATRASHRRYVELCELFRGGENVCFLTFKILKT